MIISHSSALENKLKEGAQLVDIRESDEWVQGHFEDAIFCPLSALEKGDRFNLIREKTYLLHCARGGRAQVAQKFLEKEGYSVCAVLLSFDDLKKQLKITR